jgi:hypothetical protein
VVRDHLETFLAERQARDRPLPRYAERALRRFQRDQARRLLGVRGGESGAVTVLQRFGSSCELNLHFHTVRPDGVFTVDRAGGLTFHRLPGPERHELDRLVQEITAAVKRLLVRRGLWEDDGDGGQPTEDAGDEPMADLFAASVQNRLGTGPRPGGRLRRIRSAAPRPPRDGIKTRVAGFDLHVSSRIGKKRCAEELPPGSDPGGDDASVSP